MYHVQTDYFYKVISQDVESMFDTSNYPKHHKSGIPTGKDKMINGGLNGKQIFEFVGLRAKLYWYKMVD